MYLTRFLLLFFIYALSISFISAQNKLSQALKGLEEDPALQYASIGFYALDIDRNQVIAAKNPEQSLATASTMKAITTGTALQILGSDYRFETCLEYDGSIKDGVLYGNIYITGSGDPSLASPYMEGVPDLEELALEFIKAIKKNIAPSVSI